MSETVAAESAAAAETGEAENDSMEKLQIDEEEEKNVSVEDILGGNMLIMSESEDEGKQEAKGMGDSDEEQGEASKTKKKKAALIDSESEKEEEEEQVAAGGAAQREQQEEGSEERSKQAKSRKKISAIIDSESEEEQEKGQEAEEDDLAQIKNRKKISAIIDSESEQEQVEAGKDPMTVSKMEQEAVGHHKTKSRKKISAIIDSESEEEAGQAQEAAAVKQKTQKQKISAIIDSDSEEEQQNGDKKTVSKQEKIKKKLAKKRVKAEEQSASSSDEESNSKLKGIVDSESESENNQEEEAREQQEHNEETKERSSKSKPMRATAKKALDAMQAIQSEQQRLQREAHISVPYHQPKPRTLKEFLSRRTINKPLAVALAGGSPMPAKREPRRSLALRMNSEELQAYAKLMEERAKEATEFFKSESEQEEEAAAMEMQEKPAEPLEMQDNTVVLDIVAENVAKAAETPAEAEETAAKPEAEQETVTALPNESSSPTKVRLVTDVVELPKLDLSKLNITPPAAPTTPRISEALRRLRDEKSCDVSPALSGDANMVIDLETGDMFSKKPTGVDDLLQRLMKTREAKKQKTTETVNILSTAHGKLELSKVSIQLHEEEPVNKEQKPGAAYQKMQEQLKTLITKKRMADMRKKQAEEVLEQQEEDEEMDMEEEYEPEEKPTQINEEEEIVDEAEEQQAEDEEQINVEDEAAEADEDEDEEMAAQDEAASSSSESEEESAAEQSKETTKRRNRIIRAFQDDNSEEEDVDLLQTPKTKNDVPITASQLQLSAHKLFDAELERTASDEENELLGLCSGRFTQSEVPATDPTAALISQIPITQAAPASQAAEELEALCSGSFDTQAAALIAAPTNKILSSEEETTAQLEQQPRQKKLTKKRQKKKAKLGFSDDEESAEDSLAEEEEQELESEAEEVPETCIDYDSEENEVVIQMTKKERKLRAANFVEKEAELSESEWGSADEDEKNMDSYDIELGDEDEFDKEKLRRELEQIHARKMLDKDIREVRQIQELLFEDDEGAVRQRQFRWKNAENGAAFSLDEARNEPGDGDANEGSGDEENEHLWRKIRYEREQLLLEKGLKGEATGSASPLSSAAANSNAAVRKFTIITAKKTNVELKKSSPFLISKSINQSQQGTVRGSFLVRDKETLNKLAGLTKGAAVDDGTAGTVSVKSAKGKNFVFATLTEEEHEHQKRKAADLLNSSSETGINFMKKPRLEPRREKCLIDQLL